MFFNPLICTGLPFSLKSHLFLCTLLITLFLSPRWSFGFWFSLILSRAYSEISMHLSVFWSASHFFLIQQRWFRSKQASLCIEGREQQFMHLEKIFEICVLLFQKFYSQKAERNVSSSHHVLFHPTNTDICVHFLNNSNLSFHFIISVFIPFILISSLHC